MRPAELAVEDRGKGCLGMTRIGTQVPATVAVDRGDESRTAGDEKHQQDG